VGVTEPDHPAPGTPSVETPSAETPAAAASIPGQAAGPTGRPPVKPGGLWLIIALGALSGFGPLCLDMYLPALPELPGDLRSTTSAAQLTLSSCILGLAVGQLVTGPLSDRFGRRWPLLIGVAIFVVASAVCALTTSMTLLIAVRFVQGAAGAAGIVVGRAVVADLFAGKAAAAYFSAIATINGLAPILAPVIGGQVLQVGTWRTVFWVLTGIGVVLFALSAVVVRETLPAERRSSGGFAGTLLAFRVLLGDRGYVGCVLAGAMVTAAMFGYISASPFVLQEGFGLSPQWFSACFALNAIGIIIATQVGRMLLSRTTSFVLLAWGVGQSLVGAVLLTVTVLAQWGLPMVLVSLFVLVSAVGLALPHASAIAMDRHRDIAGSASALLGLTQFALGAVTAPLVGIGDSTTGVAMAVTALGASVIGLAALLFARPVVHTDEDAPHRLAGRD